MTVFLLTRNNFDNCARDNIVTVGRGGRLCKTKFNARQKRWTKKRQMRGSRFFLNHPLSRSPPVILHVVSNRDLLNTGWSIFHYTSRNFSNAIKIFCRFLCCHCQNVEITACFNTKSEQYAECMRSPPHCEDAWSLEAHFSSDPKTIYLFCLRSQPSLTGFIITYLGPTGKRGVPQEIINILVPYSE